MSPWKKALLLQLLFVVGFPLVGLGLIGAFRFPGALILAAVFFLWCWQIFAFLHYRTCRQEEFLFVLRTAAATQAPVEGLLRAYLEDRPREHIYRGLLLLFVFPGFYWIHLQRSFDARLTRLAAMLESGISLHQALVMVPGIVTQEVALAVTVGQFSGNLPDALLKLPERRFRSMWIDLGTRMLYPILLIVMMLGIVGFLMLQVVPRLEKIFADFKFDLPGETEALIACSQFLARESWLLPFLIIDGLIVFNLLLFGASLRWYLPFLGDLYRMQLRGQFLRMLGLMLETGKPLPTILERVLDSGLLAYPLQTRAALLAAELRNGAALADGLVRHGLAPENAKALIVAAEKANNLPLALREIGDGLLRRSTRNIERIAALAFPTAIFLCAVLIGLVGHALFAPVIALIEKFHRDMP